MSSPELHFQIDRPRPDRLPLARAMDRLIKISGTRLAKIRADSFFTQEELARELKMSKGRITAIESKDETGMYAPNFRKLAEIFKRTPLELLEEIGAGEDAAQIARRVRIPADVHALVSGAAKRAGQPVDEWLINAIREAAETFDIRGAVIPPDSPAVPTVNNSRRGPGATQSTRPPSVVGRIAPGAPTRRPADDR